MLLVQSFSLSLSLKMTVQLKFKGINCKGKAMLFKVKGLFRADV